MAVTIDETQASTKSRLVLVTFTTLTMRLMERWWNLASHLMGRTPDYESIMILGAVFSINSEKLLRSEIDLSLQSLEVPMPYELLSDSNVSSVSAATGLNRETTRRRVNTLVKEGVLVREGAALRLAHGMMQDPLVREMLQAQLETFRMASDQLDRLAVLQHG